MFSLQIPRGRVNEKSDSTGEIDTHISTIRTKLLCNGSNIPKMMSAAKVDEYPEMLSYQVWAMPVTPPAR